MVSGHFNRTLKTPAAYVSAAPSIAQPEMSPASLNDAGRHPVRIGALGMGDRPFHTSAESGDFKPGIVVDALLKARPTSENLDRSLK
jgi:hypothetical protein